MARKVVATVVLNAPNRRRQVGEILDFDRTPAYDLGAMARSGAQVLFDEIRQRYHVVVDEDDPLARRPGQSDVPSSRQSCIGLRDDSEGAGGASARLLDHARRVVGRPVVDENDFVGVGVDRLVEARFERSCEQRRTIVRAELNGRANHARSDLTAARIRDRSRCAMQA
jgi:hypothetical protein